MKSKRKTESAYRPVEIVTADNVCYLRKVDMLQLSGYSALGLRADVAEARTPLTVHVSLTAEQFLSLLRENKFIENRHIVRTVDLDEQVKEFRKKKFAEMGLS